MTMTFKDVLQHDIDQVFLNLADFAEVQELAGKTVPVVSEYLEIQPDQGERPGVSYDGITLFVSLQDVPDDLMPHKRISYQGQEWWVLEANRERLRTIRLYRERA